MAVKIYLNDFKIKKQEVKKSCKLKEDYCQFISKKPVHHFLQKEGANNMSTVKSSRRPRSIKKERNHFPGTGI